MAAIKQLAAVTRSGTGKGAARSVRREGRVPAVIYGGGEKPEPISVDFKDVNKLIYAGHFLTTIFELDIDGRKERVLPRDYQLDVVTDRPVHVDFLRLTPGSRVRIGVPVHVENREASPGVEEGRRGQPRAPHGRGAGAGRRDSRGDHHRPHRPRLPRFGARLGAQAAGRLQGRSRPRPTSRWSPSCRRRSWPKRRRPPRPPRRGRRRRAARAGQGRSRARQGRRPGEGRGRSGQAAAAAAKPAAKK